jgi:acyl-CoA thioester hydrolase
MEPLVSPNSTGQEPAEALDANSQSALQPVTFRGVVYPWHLDHMDHMNVQHYVGMFDQATWVLLGMLGLDAPYFRANHCGMAALEQNITYLSELRAGDALEIRSAIIDVREKTVHMLHRMHKMQSGALAASTTILGVHMDTKIRKSAPLPAAVRDRARAMICPEALSGSAPPTER